MDVRVRPLSEEGKGEFWKGSGNGESSGVSRKFDPNDPCTYSTIRKYKCFLDGNDSSGSPVQKCERTEQLLRRCPGRSDSCRASESSLSSAFRFETIGTVPSCEFSMSLFLRKPHGIYVLNFLLPVCVIRVSSFHRHGVFRFAKSHRIGTSVGTLIAPSSP
jgi:hypothetical protein